jgi:hypothetical protein
MVALLVSLKVTTINGSVPAAAPPIARKDVFGGTVGGHVARQRLLRIANRKCPPTPVLKAPRIRKQGDRNIQTGCVALQVSLQSSSLVRAVNTAHVRALEWPGNVEHR